MSALTQLGIPCTSGLGPSWAATGMAVPTQVTKLGTSVLSPVCESFFICNWDLGHGKQASFLPPWNRSLP